MFYIYINFKIIFKNVFKEINKERIIKRKLIKL